MAPNQVCPSCGDIVDGEACTMPGRPRRTAFVFACDCGREWETSPNGVRIITPGTGDLEAVDLEAPDGAG